MKILKNITVVLTLFFIIWATHSITKSQCDHDFIYKKAMVFNEGCLKGKRSIADAPHILNSLIATKSLGFSITDTYFARGTSLRDFLLEITKIQGLKPNYIFGPNVFVSIDGNAQGVIVQISMARDAYLDVSFDCYNAYKDDIFVVDSIICYSQKKHFPPGTQYEDVTKWLEKK